ncbi:MAG: hypothetical protein HOH33_03545 [Verrucomicrobia bacterium]|jgi:hypothetical protein|nr:hypothetical protein [Verrucomicrobiota bacterium]
MNEHPDSHQKVEKLIALKRFECPPPDHQDLLASKIISRLEAEQMRAKEPWFRRCMHSLNINPFLTTAYTAAIMALLAFGWHYGEHFESDVPVKSYGTADLRVGLMGLSKNESAATLSQGLGIADFTLEMAPKKSYSSIQPVVHIPGSLVPWLRESTPIQSDNSSWNFTY